MRTELQDPKEFFFFLSGQMGTRFILSSSWPQLYPEVIYFLNLTPHLTPSFCFHAEISWLDTLVANGGGGSPPEQKFAFLSN